MEVEQETCKESENEMSEIAMDMRVEEIVGLDESTEFLCTLLDRGILFHKDPLIRRC